MSDTGSNHRDSSLSSIHFLDLDGGSDQNQTDEKNKEQTEELGGRDDENRSEEKTEKQINETTENSTQYKM